MRESRRLTASIADREDIDWQQLDATGLAVDEQRVLGELRAIASASAQTPASTGAAVFFGTTWIIFVGMTGLAAIKTLVGLASLFVYFRGSSGSALPWMQVLCTSLFGCCGVLLLAGGASDRRAQGLGTLFLFVASAFADSLIWTVERGFWATLNSSLRAAPAEAFFAASFWHFLRVFPSESIRLSHRRLADVAVSVSIVLGIVMFTANVAISQGAALSGRHFIWALDRHSPTSAFWPLLLVFSAPGVPHLLAKARFVVADQRRRVLWFMRALVIGLGPVVLVAGITPAVPALRDPDWRPVVGHILYGSLLSLIPVTIYAVRVQHVLRWQLILKRTWQYSIVRGAVWVAAIGSVVYVLAWQSRLSGSPWGALSFLPIAGLGVAMFRAQLLEQVDRWFSLNNVESTEIIARLSRRLEDMHHPREMLGVLTQEIDRAVHPANITAFARGPADAQWESLGGNVPPLAGDSDLIYLLTSMRLPIMLDERQDETMRLLRPAEREWASLNHLRVFWPLFRTSGTLIAIVATGEARSGMAYPDRDRLLIAALTSHTALRLENSLLRLRTGGDDRPASEIAPPSTERAWFCRSCDRLSPVAAQRCVCGGDTQQGAVPLLVDGKFRLQRLIGAGGSAVVYEAVDLTINRRVAIKTLPAMGRAAVERIQREARAMALVTHPNLAIVLAVDYWRDIPLLVVEYLPNGTLADRLRHGPLDMYETLAMGELLSKALIKLHASGLLHRDIKPSNIAYTDEGVPKLLDFGLAGLVEDVNDELLEGPPPSVVSTAGQSANDVLFVGGARPHAIAGTPLYLSPEAVRGDPPSPSFDLWSLSLTLYQALAGRLPLEGGDGQEVLARIPSTVTPDLRKYRPGCPAGVATFFADALSLDERRRPATAAQMQELLRTLREGS